MIVVLTRGISMPKDLWRSPGRQRTLAPIDAESLIMSVYGAYPQRDAILSMSLNPDGSPIGPPSIREMQQGTQKGYAGVFDLSIEANGEVRVTLRDEDCLRQLGIPRRGTRQIGTLRTWRPLRILLNGRMSDYSGQIYIVREYHLVLCNEPVPALLEPERFVDLQEDLA